VRRIAEALEACRSAGRLGFIPYLTAGDPDAETTVALVRMLAKEGADIIELGVPFSDPLADGRTNQKAAARALSAGTNLAGVLDIVGRIRNTETIPLVLFTYFNPIYRMGVEDFARRASRAGVDGVLVTDLPPDEGDVYRRVLAATGLDPIFMVAPTSDPDRRRMIARHTGAFIYYVCRTGVTGAREELPAGLREDVARLRLASNRPVAVGFGISRRAHLEALTGVADAAVVGSALVRCIEKSGGGTAAVEAVRALVRELLGKTARTSQGAR
jgi:tryptophan synthase alpha chain